MEFLSANLKKIRSEKGLTRQNILVSLINNGIQTNLETIRQYENGMTIPRADYIAKLAEIYRVPVNYFFC